ncbi:cupin domain-containing protein [Jeongeupia chitinilytica]|uniref:Cupin n=1 Tax=Jeongeupia chitinilytica TaxID=1041641 RepID=A0ABQ3GXY2_9NEIS|nr:cupin domain-containing protein [Jeongeupia chitinilytica]GHD60557.1 cupin [Jeongeupia chitinilytica]
MKSYCMALATIVALIAPPLLADDDVTFTNPGQIKWEKAPPDLPKGAKVAVLHGDPGKPGPFTIRLSAPAGYRIPAHWHSQAENLTVISGEFYLGLGDKLDKTKAHGLKAGGYHYLPANVHHYAFTKTRTVVQASGEGPFDIHYLDPADNPAGK